MYMLHWLRVESVQMQKCELMFVVRCKRRDIKQACIVSLTEVFQPFEFSRD